MWWPFSRKPAGPGRCEVYFRPEGTFVLTRVGLPGGNWMTADPFLELPAQPAPEALGKAILKCLGASKVLKANAMVAGGGFARRFPRWDDFREDNRGLQVNRSEEGQLSVVPCSNTRDGFVPRPELGREAGAEARVLGDAVLLAREGADIVVEPPPSAEPGRPVAFGRKCKWLAVRGQDPALVARALGLKAVVPCSWTDGMARAFEQEGVFVTPSLQGWCFAVGDVLEPSDTAAHDPALLQLGDLSQKFGDAQLFCSHRVADIYAWARAREGSIERAFAASPDDVDWRMGKATPEEAGFRFFDPTCPEAATDAYWEREDLDHPGEEHVLVVARGWSLDPTTLGEVDEEGVGLWGRLST